MQIVSEGQIACKIFLGTSNRPSVFIEVSFYDQHSSIAKHAHSNILKIFPPKNENFQIKNSDILPISAQKHRLWYSLEPPRQSVLLSRNKKNNVYPCKPIPVNPSFTIYKWGLRKSKLYRYVFVMDEDPDGPNDVYTIGIDSAQAARIPHIMYLLTP